MQYMLKTKVKGIQRYGIAGIERERVRERGRNIHHFFGKFNVSDNRTVVLVATNWIFTKC